MIGKRGQILTSLAALGFSGALAIIVLLVGLPIAIKIIQLLFFTKVIDGAVPIWAIFAVGFAIVFLWRKL